MKKGRYLKRIPNLAEADVAICCIWGFQDKFYETESPSMRKVLEVLMMVFSKVINASSSMFDNFIK